LPSKTTIFIISFTIIDLYPQYLAPVYHGELFYAMYLHIFKFVCHFRP